MYRRISIIVGVLFLIFLVSFNIIRNESVLKNDATILIEYSYSNYAWGYQYSGMVIYTDGSIYSFNISDNTENLDNFSKYIKENGKLKLTGVSNADLEKILVYANEIDAESHSERKSIMFDAGSTSIILYQPNTNSQICLWETGDVQSVNTSPNADKLVNLVKKYVH